MSVKERHQEEPKSEEYHFALPADKSHSIRLPKPEELKTPSEPKPNPEFTVKPTVIPPYEMYHHHDSHSEDEHEHAHAIMHAMEE